MQRLAHVLIAVGFLAGSYFSVIDTEGVAWWGVVPALLVGLAGVAIVQVRARIARGETDAVRSNIERLEASLASITRHAEEMDRGEQIVDPYPVRHRIDDLFMRDLDTFVDNRESIAHAYGLQAYADVMTAFATGERYLNRSWSASTDGYLDEVRDYLSRARVQFEEALALLRAHTRRAPEGP